MTRDMAEQNNNVASLSLIASSGMQQH